MNVENEIYCSYLNTAALLIVSVRLPVCHCKLRMAYPQSGLIIHEVRQTTERPVLWQVCYLLWEVYKINQEKITKSVGLCLEIRMRQADYPPNNGFFLAENFRKTDTMQHNRNGRLLHRKNRKTVHIYHFSWS